MAENSKTERINEGLECCLFSEMLNKTEQDGSTVSIRIDVSFSLACIQP